MTRDQAIAKVESIAGDPGFGVNPQEPDSVVALLKMVPDRAFDAAPESFPAVTHNILAGHLIVLRWARDDEIERSPLLQIVSWGGPKFTVGFQANPLDIHGGQSITWQPELGPEGRGHLDLGYPSAQATIKSMFAVFFQD